jgi:AraC family transcriptional regulator
LAFWNSFSNFFNLKFYIFEFYCMRSNILLIKNMVCNRCIMTVESILQKGNIAFHKVVLGEIHLADDITNEKQKYLESLLEKVGFELIDTHTGGLVEKIKQHIIKKARNEVSEKENRMTLSAYLSSGLNYEYTHLSSLFSDIEGRTIENYFIEQRIEKAKELLVYGQLTLAEIASELDYSSAAYLSSQFKKVTGLTPSHFKQVGLAKRKAIDQI